MIGFALSAAAVVHGCVSSIVLNDLLKTSKCQRKRGWAIIVVAVPVLGIVAYDLTHRRKRVSR
ncbi:PLDc N-terminal domain-containing protein [Chryseolinea soli]|uniref:Cardiolipin synthase N-terminal domain-containing protein n=1 Tax=Chryseolinea soli TaxID=2321403 RepID=A0A385SNU9_9BACT|nr:hypothetical protein D4L85_17165 [Chryseolinea soli]